MCSKILLLTFTLLYGEAFAQNNVLSSISKLGKKYTDFVPKGYQILDSVAGDLNEDSLTDAVLVLNFLHESETTRVVSDSLFPRILLILFGSKNGFTLAEISNKLVLGSNPFDWGDPLKSIKIETNSILIDYWSGRPHGRWAATYKFKYQDKNWYLINRYRSSWSNDMCDGDNMALSEEKDENFITGEIVDKTTSRDCKNAEKHTKIKSKPQIVLPNFNTKKDLENWFSNQ